MHRPFNGLCPYCAERMVMGLHSSSWVEGAIIGVATFAMLMVMWALGVLS